MYNKYSGLFSSKFIFLGAFFTLSWCIFTGIYYNVVINAYTKANLSDSLLTTFSIFFAATIVVASIFISTPNLKENKIQVEGLRSLSIGISILLIANIASNFTVGYLETICIFYQVWTAPALIFVFYLLFKQPLSQDVNKQSKPTE